MKSLHIALIVALGVCVASPVLAAKKKKGDEPCPAAQEVKKITKGLTLTDDQTAKIDALKKDYGPKMTESKKQAAEATKQVNSLTKDLDKKVMELLTDEQKAQLKPKKADGKKGDGKKHKKAGKPDATNTAPAGDAVKPDAVKPDTAKPDATKTDAK